MAVVGVLTGKIQTLGLSLDESNGSESGRALIAKSLTAPSASAEQASDRPLSQVAKLKSTGARAHLMKMQKPY